MWVIRAPASQAYAARRLLVQLNLPREERPGFDGMLAERGLIPTKTDERARMMHATAQELETTFESYQRVIESRVHVVIPDDDTITGGNPEATPSASVFIKYSAGSGEGAREASTEDEGPSWLHSSRAKEIVVNAVEGLQDEDVAVAYEAVQVGAAFPGDETSTESGVERAVTSARLGAAARDRQTTLLLALVVFFLGFVVASVMFVRERRRYVVLARRVRGRS